MSQTFELNGKITDIGMFKYCYTDPEWFYHYRRFIEFKHLKNKFEQLMIEEYNLLSQKENDKLINK